MARPLRLLAIQAWRVFGQQFHDIARMRVLALGGTVKHWETSPLRAESVVGVKPVGRCQRHLITPVQGDAMCRPMRFRWQDFGLVYSNSLIEHLGGHARRAAFAEQVRSLAPRHWVQTPYRYSLIKPHWLVPPAVHATQATGSGGVGLCTRRRIVAGDRDAVLLGLEDSRTSG